MCTCCYAIIICTQILQGWGKGQHGLKREVDDVSNDVAAGDAPNAANTSISSIMQHGAVGAVDDSAAAQIQSMKRRRSNSLGMHTSEVRTAAADTTTVDLLLC
jgi:hypothetical protein